MALMDAINVESSTWRMLMKKRRMSIWAQKFLF